MFRVLLLSFVALAFTGCATSQMPRPLKTSMVETKNRKSKTDVLIDVSRALTLQGFKVASLNKETGILTTEPKSFTMYRGLVRAPVEGKSVVQVIRMETGLQVQISHLCRYEKLAFGTSPFGMTSTSQDMGFSPCVEGDYAANEAIPGEELAIEKAIRESVSIVQTSMK